MTWTKLSDGFTDSPRMLTLSRSARLLHIESLVWCNKHLTDGGVPRAALPRITDAETPCEDAAELVRAGLWQETPEGWQVDWTDQETADQVNARRDQQAKKQAAYRRRGELHRAGDHSECTDNCKHRVTGNATSNVTGLVTPSRPDPSRPVPKERERERVGWHAGADSASAPSAGVPHDPDEPAPVRLTIDGKTYASVEDYLANQKKKAANQ